MFRYHLLGLLQAKELHGYALMKEYQRRSGLDVAPGAFYRELRTLTEQGLVRKIKAAGDPRRTPYRITELGHEAFDGWFDDIPRATPCPENEFASRLLFFAQVEPERASRVLDRWRRGLWDATREIEATLQREHIRGASENDSSVLLLQRRLSHIATDLRFLDNVEKSLELPEVEPEELERLRDYVGWSKRALS